MDFPFLDPVTAMITGALGDRLRPTGNGYLDMFHEDAAFDFPFMQGGPVSKVGKRSMGEYLAPMQDAMVFEVFTLLSMHVMDDGIVVMEYSCKAHEPASGTPYPQAYVAVMRIVDGRLSFFREYFNPLLNLALSGRTAAQAMAARQPRADSKAAHDGTPAAKPIEAPLPDILNRELGDRLSSDAKSSFTGMFADDGVLECPWAPVGAMRHLVGRDAIAIYFERLMTVQGADGMTLTGSYQAADHPVTVLEYEGTARNLARGTAYPQAYVALVETKRGHVALFREYWNGIPVVATFGPAGPVPMPS